MFVVLLVCLRFYHMDTNDLSRILYNKCINCSLRKRTKMNEEMSLIVFDSFSIVYFLCLESLIFLVPYF